MDPRSIPKIARWAAMAAAAIVLVVAGIFAHRAWLASQAMKHAPPAVPASVEQRSLQFTFSKVDGQQTVFTIHAARATEFSGGKNSVLEDVDIVVYGAHGERHDEIHTRSCNYVPSSGEIVCRGKVQLDLGSAPVPGKAIPAAKAGIHIETSGVHFDRETGEATTNAPVEFRFPQGSGTAIGVEYSSRQEQIVLGRDVDLTLAPDRSSGASATVVSKGGLSYNRASGQLRLNGPVGITKGDRTFKTAGLTVETNKELQPERAVAVGGATVEANDGTRPASFRADETEISFDKQGRAERVKARGDVRAREGGIDQLKLDAATAEVTLNPADQQPRDVFASGDVRLASKENGTVTRMRTDELHLTAVPAGPGAAATTNAKPNDKAAAIQLERARTDGPASVEWQSGQERLRLDAGQLAASFGEGNEIRVLRGSEGVKVDRQEAGKLPVRTTAKSLRVDFADGEWVRAEEAGDVRATQGERRASAEQATWSKTRDVMKLSGSARVNDADSQTLARRIVWNQKTGDLRASGNVRSTYFAANGKETHVGPSTGPASVVAQTLVANSSTGDAVFTGGARLWQGDEVIQADRLELRRQSRELIATGKVMGAFPQVQGASRPAAKKVSKGKAATGTGVLWRVQAKRLTYVNRGADARKTASGEATLEGGVKAWSSDGEIDASRLVLRMRRGANGRAEVWQARGDGGVLVRQGERWGRAERALYDAEAGKFVLSGGKPSLHDTSGDLVRGDELTFYVADDTILIESVKGSRTVTMHPIQKN